MRAFFLCALVLAVLQCAQADISQYEYFKRLRRLYNTVDEMWTDVAKRVCNARLKKRPADIRKQRCKMLVDYVRESSEGMITQMAESGVGTSDDKELFKSAASTANLVQFRDLLYSTCDMLKFNKRVTVNDIRESMSKLSQLIMDVVTKKEGNLQTFASLPQTAVDNLKRKGISVPDYDILDGFDVDVLLDPDDEL